MLGYVIDAFNLRDTPKTDKIDKIDKQDKQVIPKDDRVIPLSTINVSYTSNNEPIDLPVLNLDDIPCIEEIDKQDDRQDDKQVDNQDDISTLLNEIDEMSKAHNKGFHPFNPDNVHAEDEFLNMVKSLPDKISNLMAENKDIKAKFSLLDNLYNDLYKDHTKLTNEKIRISEDYAKFRVNSRELSEVSLKLSETLKDTKERCIKLEHHNKELIEKGNNLAQSCNELDNENDQLHEKHNALQASYFKQQEEFHEQTIELNNQFYENEQLSNQIAQLYRQLAQQETKNKELVNVITSINKIITFN